MHSGARTTDRGRQASEGFLERIEHAFEKVVDWASAHPAFVFGGLGLLLACGVAVAGLYEWSRSQREQAFTSLASLERDLAAALPGSPAGLEVEPANPALAAEARRDALEGFSALSEEQGGNVVGFAAAIRAAEMEIELDQLEAAEARLREWLPRAPNDALHATALRLHGFVLEELDRPREAAEQYMRAGAQTGYSARAPAYWQAGNTFERIGALEEAVKAYDAAASVSQAFAEQNRIEDRLLALRGRLARGAASPAGSAQPGESQAESAPAAGGAPAAGDPPPAEGAAAEDAPPVAEEQQPAASAETPGGVE